MYSGIWFIDVVFPVFWCVEVSKRSLLDSTLHSCLSPEGRVDSAIPAPSGTHRLSKSARHSVSARRNQWITVVGDEFNSRRSRSVFESISLCKHGSLDSFWKFGKTRSDSDRHRRRRHSDTHRSVMPLRPPLRVLHWGSLRGLLGRRARDSCLSSRRSPTLAVQVDRTSPVRSADEDSVQLHIGFPGRSVCCCRRAPRLNRGPIRSCAVCPVVLPQRRGLRRCYPDLSWPPSTRQ